MVTNRIVGMQTVWSFGDAVDITSKWPEPYVSGYLQYGGDAYGNATFDPLVNNFYPENPNGYAKTCKNWDGGSKGKYQYR
jgi:L-ascorbate oxidase